MRDRLGPRHPASGGRPGRCLAYLATSFGAVMAAVVLALASAPALSRPSAQAEDRAASGAAAAGMAASDGSGGFALVAIDRTPLRATPHAGAVAHHLLARGDLLEVRGQDRRLLQVVDARRGRAGFVPADAVRPVSPQSADADVLLAVLRLLRQAPGREALGITYAAAYLDAVDPQRIDAEPFDALGVMADRLARRASGAEAAPEEALAAHLGAASARGVRFVTLVRAGRRQLCYDGEAFRRVLALKPEPAQQARAMLALTRPDCVDPMMTASGRVAFDAWRAEVLDLPWHRGYDTVPALMKSRLHMRRAGLWAARAHQLSRLHRDARQAAGRALAELAEVDPAEFTAEDRLEHAEAAIRVGAVRWAAQPSAMPDAMAEAAARGLRLVVHAGPATGQSCVLLLASEGSEVADPPRATGTPGMHRGAPGLPADAAAGPRLLAERCTFGTVWARSVAVRPAGDAVALAVQAREGWTELWVFRTTEADAGVQARARGPWRVDVLAPTATVEPDLGYVEFAGWVPGAQRRLLVAREARAGARFERRFEVLALDSLDTPDRASAPHRRVAFGQWGDAQWRRHTVALR